MQIQWFPGHMHKARMEMESTLPKVDLLIEVLDARIPYSSENPMLAELRGDKPCLKVLTKSDLADPEQTKVWEQHYDESKDVWARPVTSKEPGTIRRLKGVINEMLPKKRSITTMVVGIPNVGKSTIINILAGKKVAKTGNEPAVTKMQQRINIGDGITLLDTPGVMWPNVENINSGFRLGLLGSIKDTAVDYADIGYFGARYLLENHPDRVIERFGLESQPENETELIEAIGQRRGCLGRSGVVDIDRVSRILVNEVRSGMLGLLTLETPEIMKWELVQTAKRMEEQAAKKAEKDAKRLKRFKAKQRAKKKAKKYER
jgi:ribosome biogenesis GTPase A